MVSANKKNKKMALEDLNKQLYDENSAQLAQRTHATDEFNPAFGTSGENPFAKEEQWERYQKKMDAKGKRKLWIWLGVVLACIFLIGGVVWYRIAQNRAFFEDRVELNFQGPKEADSTQPVKYVINFANNNAVTLKNVEIVLTYPENFQPTNNVNLKILNSTSSRFSLENDIKPRSSGSVELNGVFYAPKDFPVYLRAEMKYTPSNGKTEFVLKNQISVNIASSPVALDVTAPDQVSDGDLVEYVIDFKNPDTRALKDIKIRAEYPEGFEFLGAQPVASEKENVWYVGVLDSQQGGKIQIKGIQHGLKDEIKPFKVSLGYMGKDNNFIVYSQKGKDIKIGVPMLSITQTLQGTTSNIIKAGDTLTYVIKYKNNGDIGLRDAVVSAQIESSVLDFNKLTVEKGFFNGEKNTITWRAAEVPSLANIEPQATGELRFSVPVKNMISVQNENDKNFTVTSVAKIDSPDIPTPIGSNKIIGSNRLNLKLKSKIFLDAAGFYKDEKIPNTGPIPPKVGNFTTYVLHLTVASINNDLNGVKVVTSLPAGVEWTGKTYPEGANFTYNARTKELIWDVGEVRAGAGARLPKNELIFQVGIKPQINQVGQFFKLLNKITLTGKDVFTGENVTLENAGKDSQIREDSSVGPDGYKISP